MFSLIRLAFAVLFLKVYILSVECVCFSAKGVLKRLVFFLVDGLSGWLTLQVLLRNRVVLQKGEE